ncbi:MAG: hypothetical protein GX605_04355 [Chloroflexi bacterium]|nr:hypothetical protein [Chloroflexota bacterium]
MVENRSIAYRRLAMDDLRDALAHSQDEFIARYQRFALPIATQTTQRALDQAGLRPCDLAGLAVNPCTGNLCPGLSGYVAEALGLPPAVHPFDLMGMGCGGALPNLELGASFVQCRPGAHFLSLAVEVCSANLFLSEARHILVSNAIFGDGAAAAVLTSRPDAPGVQLVRFAAGLYPEHRRHLHPRWEAGRLRNILSTRVPLAGARAAGPSSSACSTKLA